MKAKIEIALEVATKEYKQTKQSYDAEILERNKLRQESDVI